jgi:hypothetical protein
VSWYEFYNFPDGWPSGKVGLYTTVANTTFDYVQFYTDHPASDLAGRWTNTSRNAIISSDRLQLFTSPINDQRPILLKNLRLAKWRATFAVRRDDAYGGAADVKFVFNATDLDDYDYLAVPHRSTAIPPCGHKVEEGHKAQAVTETASNAPNMATGSDPLWVRVTSDGTTVSARVLAQASEPTDGQWNGTSDIYSSSGFDMIGGMIGFASRVGVGSVDDVTVRSWPADGSRE